MTPLEFTSSWGPWLVATAGTAAACYERFRGKRKDESKQVAAAKDELVQVLKDECAAWKSRFETSHAEMEAYRNETHRKADEVNSRMLHLTDENARLKSATDITPILKHQEEQSQINVKMLTALDEVLAHLSQLTPCAGKRKPTKPKRPAKS